MTINVLGTMYHVIRNVPEEQMCDADGMTDFSTKTIKIVKFVPGEEVQDNLKAVEKRTLRHEIIHAFLFESGLDNSSGAVNAWARNEEMVDWFALQYPRICEVITKAEKELDEVTA